MSEENAPWVLSGEDAERFVRAMADAPPPNAALREAAGRYRAALAAQRRGNVFPLPIMSDGVDEREVRGVLAGLQGTLGGEPE